MKSTRPTGQQKGLTLIEVLVALVVLTTALASVLGLLSIQTRNTVAIRENVLGRIVAENALVEITANARRGQRDETGATVEIGQLSFQYEVDRVPLGISGFDQLTVRVSTGGEGTREGRQVATLSTLVPQ